MHQRLWWYKLLFIINTIAVLSFTFYITYDSIFSPKVLNRSEVMGFIIIGGLFVFYSLNNWSGLNLIKRIQQNKDISGRRITWTIVGLVFLGLLEIFFIFALLLSGYIFLKNYWNRRFPPADPEMLFFFGILTIIVLTGAYNFFSTIRLIKMVRYNKKAFDEMVQEIGSN